MAKVGTPRVKLHRDLLRPGGPMQPWIDAFRAMDEAGDKRPLLKLLGSDAPMPDQARLYLMDLLGRYELKHPLGGQQTPAYTLSPADSALSRGKATYRELRQRGVAKADAVAVAAKLYKLDPEVFQNYLDGKHSSSRRMKKRRSKLTPVPESRD